MDEMIHQKELDYLRDKFWQTNVLDVIRTNSPKMREIFTKIKSAAPTRATILLVGETGTGKGVLARLLHQHSTRKDQSFIGVHCGAIPDNLIESELFGHEKGAFTGAHQRKFGKFEIAQGGTIFLDEIATMPLSAQIKLLQILQDKTFHRVGGNDVLDSDVRIIAATNVDLKSLCENGQFREDLYYRLNVFPIEIPPLRERVEDIPILAEFFLKKLNQDYPKNIMAISDDVLAAFRSYSWPGNIRELENLVERAYILEPSNVLTPESFPSEFFTFQTAGNSIEADINMTLAHARQIGIENLEKRYLRDILTANKGKIADSAEAAGISTRQLHKLMTKYSIKKEEFKYLPPVVGSLEIKNS